MSKEKQDLWQEYNFFDVIEVLDFRGRTPKKLNLDWGGDIPALSANNVKMGKIDYSLTTNFGSEELYSKWMTKGDLEIGDLVLTTEAPAGNVVVINDNKKYILSQRVIGLKPDKRVIDSNYLMYFFMSNYFKNYLQGYGTGTTVTGISQKNLEFLKIIAPPLEEQQKIAEILSSVDATIEKTEQVIAKTEEVKKGLMQQLLTKGIGHTEFKQTEIGEIPIAWSVKRIKDLVSFSGGAQPPRKEFVFEPREGYIRLIQIRDYKNDKYATYIPKELAKKLCDATDIMIGRYGPPIFQILRGIEGAYNVALIKAIPDEIYLNKDYLYYFLQRQDLFNLIDHLSQRSSGQTGIDMEALNNFGFPLPQLEEQMEIVKIIRNIENKIHTEKIKYSKLNAVKTGLMQHLLTGKTRVKVD